MKQITQIASGAPKQQHLINPFHLNYGFLPVAQTGCYHLCVCSDCLALKTIEKENFQIVIYKREFYSNHYTGEQEGAHRERKKKSFKKKIGTKFIFIHFIQSILFIFIFIFFVSAYQVALRALERIQLQQTIFLLTKMPSHIHNEREKKNQETWWVMGQDSSSYVSSTIFFIGDALNSAVKSRSPLFI